MECNSIHRSAILLAKIYVETLSSSTPSHASLYICAYICVYVYSLRLHINFGFRDWIVVRLLCRLSSASSPNPLLEGSVHPGTYLKDFT